MKIEIVKNKYLNSLLLLMLFSAIIHMAILLYLALRSGDPYILNYFNILDLDLFFANIFNSSAVNALSVVVAVIIYLVILYLNKNKTE